MYETRALYENTMKERSYNIREKNEKLFEKGECFDG